MLDNLIFHMVELYYFLVSSSSFVYGVLASDESTGIKKIIRASDGVVLTKYENIEDNRSIFGKLSPCRPHWREEWQKYCRPPSEWERDQLLVASRITLAKGKVFFLGSGRGGGGGDNKAEVTKAPCKVWTDSRISGSSWGVPRLEIHRGRKLPHNHAASQIITRHQSLSSRSCLWRRLQSERKNSYKNVPGLPRILICYFFHI